MILILIKIADKTNENYVHYNFIANHHLKYYVSTDPVFKVNLPLSAHICANTSFKKTGPVNIFHTKEPQLVKAQHGI